MFLVKGALKICCKFTAEIALRYGCSPVNLLHIFGTLFPKSFEKRISVNCFIQESLNTDMLSCRIEFYFLVCPVNRVFSGSKIPKIRTVSFSKKCSNAMFHSIQNFKGNFSRRKTIKKYHLKSLNNFL